jgi:hypothetical protein
VWVVLQLVQRLVVCWATVVVQLLALRLALEALAELLLLQQLPRALTRLRCRSCRLRLM